MIHPDQIRTKSGRDLFNLVNQNYGSSIWGPILAGIIEIEREAMITCHNANVIHNIYPEGKKVPDSMMNPNIGGLIPRNNKPKDDIWATQISFEE
jgi:hypothetical protein